MNAARENILRRVRAALRTPAPRPPMPAGSAIWPPVGELLRFVQYTDGNVVTALCRRATADAPTERGDYNAECQAIARVSIETRFRQEFTALKGEIIESLPEFLAGFQKIATDGSELGASVNRFADVGRVTSRGEIVKETAASGDAAYNTTAVTGGAKLTPTGNASPREADLGVTGCECLVAQTGSIIVSRHRVVSVLPPVHLVIARREQIVADLDEAMALLRQRYDGHWPSSLAVISGPSRTADIEKILVLGAHGPKRIALHFVA